MTELSPAKQALLAKWMRGEASPDIGITRRDPGDGPIPLSFVQERQLFLELLEPYTAVNNLCVCVRIDGPLDLPLLQRSASRLVRRHDALRTSFETDRGKPLVRIAAPSALSLDLGIEDLRDRGGEAQTEALRQAEVEARRPFDVSQPPLLRVKTFRLSDDAHVLFVVVHHTIADGWSLGVFLRELLSQYQCLREGSVAGLPPLPIQYADYAAWQRQSLRGRSLERLLDFWRGQLAGELPVLELPIDHPRLARQTFTGRTHRIAVAARRWDDVRALARRHDATPFMTLIAAFATLLHRYCRQDDIAIGTPTAGRTRTEMQDLIGAFINTLVLRTDLSGDPTFGTLLDRVRAVALGAYAHQDLPFEKLVAELRPQRDLSRTPLFQVMFNLQIAPLPAIEIPGLSLRVLPLDRGAAQFDLTLIMTEAGGGLEGVFEYNADLFEAATIERFAESFQLLLGDAVAHPERPLSQLAIMPRDQRDRLVHGLNDTRADYPWDKAVHELVGAQAERTPDTVALICGDDALTYRELDRRATDLAAELRGAGVAPGVVVGICIDRSVDLVAGLLAVMKAGGTYLPIDPSTPVGRVTFALDDAHARVLLTDRAERWPDLDHAVTIHHVGATRAAVRQGVAPTGPGDPDRLAYIIYTSGSTGEPKGVPVRQRSLVNLLWSMRQLLELRPGDAFLAVTSISFDIAALELYLPLITGATVVLATTDMTRDRRRLQQAIGAHRIRMMQATPATWRMMLQGNWPGDPGLVALSGGEALTPELAEQLLERVGCLWNLYGPTETTVWSAAGRVSRGQRPITIGRPIANTQLYVVDPQLQPVPVGATGELCIGGDGVSPGYLKRPALTAERFLSDPFGNGSPSHTRLFRTGDLARYRPDGSIELVGRADDQVKVHGYRIELGDVEAALSLHPAVRAAAVVAQQTDGGDRRLVGYVVPAGDRAPNATELRTFLRAELPGYMVPAVFLVLPELPLTTAGKIDRRALPDPGTGAVDQGFMAPRTPRERRLAEIYARVLGVERVGVHDNFFDLGGGSIQVLEIIVQAQADGLSLVPETFFEHQTVAAVAAFLDEGGEA
jgi:amino acid adenylation domain-containing protein